jgi:hypothetical protein
MEGEELMVGQEGSGGSADEGRSGRSLTLDETARLTTAASALGNLLALDEVWTVYLEAAREGAVDEIDFASLIDLAGTIEAILGFVGSIVEPSIETLAGQDDDAFRIGIERLTEQMGSTELGEWILGDGLGSPLRDSFISAWRWIGDNLDDEVAVLRDKRELLSGGELCDPDLRFRFRCLVVIAGFGATAVLGGAGVVATLGLATTIGLGAVSVAGATALSWYQAGCGEDVHAALG